jgi:hypothetical protein
MSAAHLLEQIIVHSEIPSLHASKRRIEDGLRTALLGLPGHWRVEIICSRTDTWWVLRVDGPGFAWSTVLADRHDQHASRITARLLRALDEQKVLN